MFPNQQQQQQQTPQTTINRDVCAICLGNTQARGGEFLCSPGCCGKWFHMSCIEDLKKAGKNFCPCCMKPFSGGAPVSPFGATTVPTSPAFPASAQLPPFAPPTGFGGFGAVPQNAHNAHWAFGAPVSVPPTAARGFAFGANVPPPAPNAAPSFSFGAAPLNASSPATAFFGSNNSLPTATGIFARNTAPVPTSQLQEDELIPDEDIKKPAKTEAKPSSSSAATASQLQVTLTPEYREETVDAKSPFHVRVSAVFQSAVVEENKTPLDVVCVLDNSGSMSGSKIENLKRAMEFVVSTLGEKDRLSIVTFNSSATVLQGMWKMGEGRKEASRAIVRSISAGGGTDIYRGMQQGWQVLQNRKTKNPASCMFLLTDGQDGSFLEEKKQLAKTMRENGTALFIFGFGNDHDAAHLIQISNAAEGSFIYVETNDTVIDAFGGAIGTQQGQLLRDIQVTVAAQAPGVSVQSVQSGSYPSQVSADRRGGQVTLADLYGGEKRDFLLQLSLPAVSEATDSYPLLAVSVSYKMYGSEEVVSVPAVVSSIRRLSREAFLSLPSHERDLEVDVQVQRLDYTRAMQEAMREADGNNFGRAKEILAKMKTQLLESVSFKAANSFATGMLDDLNECERKISSREAYESGGGRAMMSECNDMYSRQRAVFSKGGRSRNTVEMQCVSSNMYQERATASKSSALSKPHP